MFLKKVEVQVTHIVELEYDPNSIEFKKALADYNEVIHSNSSESDLVKHAAAHIIKYGTDRIMEGAGYIRKIGRSCRDASLWSGITVIDDNPNTDTEIL